KHVEHILNKEHEGLSRSKERILEYIAVRKLKTQQKFSVLVVDDEEIARTNLEHILKKDGFHVITANNGAEAIEHMESVPFDLVLTDLLMTKVGGIELLEVVKTRYPSTEVIIVTGYATVPSAVEALQKGAYHYLSKPLKIEEVRTVVGKALARKQWDHRPRGPVLCFVGPPGTGKTSLGRAIAAALGRKFIRISLAGMKDEAEIRGHRRSYAGAMPGRIIEAIRRIGSNNPLFMLDEIDKIGQDFRGDPSSALLEVLDPEQNYTFTDHYIDQPFDLSGVMFIGTANYTEPIPPALMDRMEIIDLPGYTEKEKTSIAKRYLIKRQLKEHGLKKTNLTIKDDCLAAIIGSYTREAGVRNLERTIAAVCRNVATRIAKGTARSATIGKAQLAKILGPIQFESEIALRTSMPGVVTALAYTPVGGEILFVESAAVPGKGQLLITGKLGDVMKESAQAAFSVVKANAKQLGIDPEQFAKHDYHVHVPAGAVPKDGPSAGVAIFTSLVSLFTKRPAHATVAMTGEITLKGLVLPIGGLKDKVLAAKRAGITTVILPARNKKDLVDLPKEAKSKMKFEFIKKASEALNIALKELP
ncbi:MAG: endopeptidase La, partial [Planctomycetes bacterium]|nr:endopeptidase La [Planctomycetota bacterium]